MYIEEITIDGFKSYAQRVTVPAFDPQFNAITGLNGSGKSNILDSICFVLGISNLQRVRNARAWSQQQGTMGNHAIYTSRCEPTACRSSYTSRARPVLPRHRCPSSSTTRTRPSRPPAMNSMTRSPSLARCVLHALHNPGRARSPSQLAIGGRDKFLINGKVSQRQCVLARLALSTHHHTIYHLPHRRVVDLFHSVSLNVNNPHFLIMQGMITKVLNMKPPEILGMLEEAAGTRMYETKRQGALKTLEKKQSKVDEINKMLAEEILPALEKLKKEKVDYLQWQDASSNLDRLKRYVIAHEYTTKLQCVVDFCHLVLQTVLCGACGHACVPCQKNCPPHRHLTSGQAVAALVAWMLCVTSLRRSKRTLQQWRPSSVSWTTRLRV